MAVVVGVVEWLREEGWWGIVKRVTTLLDQDRGVGGCMGVYGRYWAKSCWDRSLRGVFVEREDFFVGGVELLRQDIVC